MITLYIIMGIIAIYSMIKNKTIDSFEIEGVLGVITFVWQVLTLIGTIVICCYYLP